MHTYTFTVLKRHGYRTLEGTFVAGCLFTGRVAGCAIASEI